MISFVLFLLIQPVQAATDGYNYEVVMDQCRCVQKSFGTYLSCDQAIAACENAYWPDRNNKGKPRGLKANGSKK